VKLFILQSVRYRIFKKLCIIFIMLVFLVSLMACKPKESEPQIKYNPDFITYISKPRIVTVPNSIEAIRIDGVISPLHAEMSKTSTQGLVKEHYYQYYFDSNEYTIIPPFSSLFDGEKTISFQFYGGIMNTMTEHPTFAFFDRGTSPWNGYSQIPPYPLVHAIKSNGAYSYVLSFLNETWNRPSGWAYEDLLYIIYLTDLPYSIYYDNYYIYLITNDTNFFDGYLQSFKDASDLYLLKV